MRRRSAAAAVDKSKCTDLCTYRHFNCPLTCETVCVVPTKLAAAAFSVLTSLPLSFLLPSLFLLFLGGGGSRWQVVCGAAVGRSSTLTLAPSGHSGCSGAKQCELDSDSAERK